MFHEQIALSLAVLLSLASLITVNSMGQQREHSWVSAIELSATDWQNALITSSCAEAGIAFCETP